MVQQLSSASPGATPLPMRCKFHILRSDTGNVHFDLCKSPTGQLRRRSLPSSVMIGGTPWQRKASFAPRSIGNLSRHPTEKPSFWCEQHEHTNSPVFQLVWIKHKTTSSLMRSVFKGINGPKVTSFVPARDNAPGKILVQDLHTSAVQLENLLRTSRS